jgi:transcriptional adapter 2-alpha
LQNNAAERRRPKEERDILNRVRHFAQLQTAQDFEDFVNGLCYEESLRRTAAQLQGWRKAGVTSLHDGLIYEKEKEDRRKKALAIAEGGIAAFPHTGMASGPRQRNETAKIARQREASVVSTGETEDKPQPVRKERTADGGFKAGRKPRECRV